MARTLDSIRDLLYLDFDKAASIWSQFEEGLTERVSVSEDAGKDRVAGTKVGIPHLAEANLSVDYQQKRSTLHSKTLHHDVLNRVERGLSDAGLVTDLSKELSADESSPQHIRAIMGNRPYLRAAGPSVLEDYQRIVAIMAKFNDIAQFLAKIGQQSIKSTPEYLQLQQLVADAKDAAEIVADRNQKALKKAEVKRLQAKLEEVSRPQVSGIEAWLLDGIRLFIDTFMPGRINFRIYPFANCPSFQVLCNLKRECFVDSDLQHLLYGYGNRPNVPLAVFGLITSLPGEAKPSFDPMKEFESSLEPSDRVAFEKGFRGVFAATEDVETFVRYSRYPNVTVHPIAVYRSFHVDVKKV